MYYKLWVARICIALAVFLLFISSSYVFYWWRLRATQTYSPSWELFALSLLLLMIAGVLLGVSPEVFLDLKNVRFSLTKFLALGIVPIIVLVFLVYCWGNWFFPPLPLFISPYIITEFGLVTLSVWVGVTIGKAFYTQGREENA